MAKTPKVYWDSSCFLAWLKPEAERFDACRQVIREAEAGKLQIVTSTVALTEVVKLKKGTLSIPNTTEEKIVAFFKHEYIVVVQLTRFIAEYARSLIWQYPHLMPKDSIHAATAIYAGTLDLHTFDKDFLPLDGSIGSTSLRIMEPQLQQRSLPFEIPPEADELEEEFEADNSAN